MAKSVLKPWKDVCILRNEIKTKTLTTADFAVDLHRVIFNPGSGKHYTDPEAFFATTYATPNLRRFCRDVLRRLKEAALGFRAAAKGLHPTGLVEPISNWHEKIYGWRAPAFYGFALERAMHFADFAVWLPWLL